MAKTSHNNLRRGARPTTLWQERRASRLRKRGQYENDQIPAGNAIPAGAFDGSRRLPHGSFATAATATDIAATAFAGPASSVTGHSIEP